MPCPVHELEEGDSVVGQPRWRRVLDLQQAADEGLLRPPSEREGGSWDDLFDELAKRAAPLLDAGLELRSTERDESWELGDSVFWDLERDGICIELEYYEHGQLVAYPASDADEENDGEPTEPYFSIYDSTLESSREAFEDHGWL